jgi:hypothetical protein
VKQTKYILTEFHPDNWEVNFYFDDEFDTLADAREKFNEYVKGEHPPDNYYLVEVEKENIANTIKPNDVAEWIQEEWPDQSVENTAEIIERKIIELKSEIEQLSEVTFWPVKIHKSFEIA